MKVSVSLAGGLDVLFARDGADFSVEFGGKPPSAEADKASGEQEKGEPEEEVTVRDLILRLADEHLTDRRDLFVVDGTVRAGILVLVNDADLELCGGLDGVLEDGDEVVFISTLHGG
jgi:ubiquitin related modifier 1